MPPRSALVLCFDSAENISLQTPRNFNLIYAAGLGWGSVSNLDTYLGFCCNKKVEKHCNRPTFPNIGIDFFIILATFAIGKNRSYNESTKTHKIFFKINIFFNSYFHKIQNIKASTVRKRAHFCLLPIS